MDEVRVPVFVAVGFWIASALAVASYTYIAFKETATGVEKGIITAEAAANPLVAASGVLAAETVEKNLTRGKFTH